MTTQGQKELALQSQGLGIFRPSAAVGDHDPPWEGGC